MKVGIEGAFFTVHKRETVCVCVCVSERERGFTGLSMG